MVNIASGVHLAEKIMKSSTEWSESADTKAETGEAKIARHARKCLFVVNIAFGVHLAEKFLKNLENLQHLDQIGQPDRRFGPNSARIVLSKAYVDWGSQTKLQ